MLQPGSLYEYTLIWSTLLLFRYRTTLQTYDNNVLFLFYDLSNAERGMWIYVKAALSDVFFLGYRDTNNIHIFHRDAVLPVHLIIAHMKGICVYKQGTIRLQMMYTKRFDWLRLTLQRYNEFTAHDQTENIYHKQKT